MSYIEYALQRSARLWQEQEQRLQESMGTVTESADTQEAQSAEMQARRRLVRRLLSAEEGASAERKSFAESVGAVPGQLAETYDGMRAMEAAKSSSSAEDGMRWLSDALKSGNTAGIIGTRTKEYAEELPPMRDSAELQALSQSVERDARRYDGGFLLY